jgi:hypothetical protein
VDRTVIEEGGTVADGASEETMLRGQRVDLGAVERVLRAHEAVREASVFVRQVDGEEHLIAYVVPERMSPEISQLEEHLRQRVSVHLVPSAFVFLDAFPTTPTGSIDVSALPAPAPLWPAMSLGYVAPRTPLETTLAAIWTDVLLVDRVGIHDDFLELGGDSLIGTQIVARMFEACQREIPLESLFERGTIAELIEDFFADVQAEAGAAE